MSSGMLSAGNKIILTQFLQLHFLSKIIALLTFYSLLLPPSGCLQHAMHLAGMISLLAPIYSVYCITHLFLSFFLSSAILSHFVFINYCKILF